MNKKGLIIIGSILGIIILFISSYISMYNSLIVLDENVSAQWSQVENQMQRRYDLIPNLVNTVKGYAKHEKEIFENIAKSRAKLAGASSVKDKISASRGLEGALSRLLMVVENYPNLKANQNFTRLMDELAGTENRLAVERRRYNEIVKIYNIKTRKFPSSIIARNLGFEKKDFFKIEKAARSNPKVTF